MSETRKELLKEAKELMSKYYPHLRGEIKQISVYFENEVSISILKDREIQYGKIPGGEES